MKMSVILTVIAIFTTVLLDLDAPVLLAQEPAKSEEPTEKTAEAASYPISKTNENGVGVTIRGIERKEAYLSVSVVITNGGSTPFTFGRDYQKNTRLTDSKGNSYLIKTEGGGKGITVPKGETMQGTLTFPGVAPEDAPPLKLLINQGASPKHTYNPEFTFENLPWGIATPAAGGAPEETPADSKKKP